MNPISAFRRRGLATFVPLVVLLLLLAGLWIIFQNEQIYRDSRLRGIHVQAEILAASVTAPLDFEDRPGAGCRIGGHTAGP